VAPPEPAPLAGSGAPRSASRRGERLADTLSELVAVTLSDNAAGVASILATVGQRRIEVERRRSPTTQARVAIHRRDCWTCRYCGGRTVAPPVLRFLSEVYPDDFPYHPNWRAGRVHPAYLLVSTSLDHVHPEGGAGAGSARTTS